MKDMEGFTVIIERDSTGMYVGEVVELSGCFTQGKSIDEVMARLEDLLPVFLE